MIAVADTSPICYLILIGEIDLLPKLFSQVLAPQAVLAELLHEDAPATVRSWASNLPSWISAKETPVLATAGLEKLQAGEQAAIVLAESIKADIILLDEKAARRVAADRGLRVTGILGILGEAVTRGLVELAPAIDRLRMTDFAPWGAVSSIAGTPAAGCPRGRPSVRRAIRAPANLSPQPGFGQLPVAHDALRRDLQHLGGLLHAKPAEKAHLDHLRLARVHFGQGIQSLVDCQDLLGPPGSHVRNLFEVHIRGRVRAPEQPAALLTPPGAGRVHQDAPHDLSRDGEEVRPVLPADARQVHQPDVGFMDQSRGLKGSAIARPHVPPGQPLQLPVHMRDQIVQGRRLSPPPGLQQAGDLLACGDFHRRSEKIPSEIL